ncbi:MAG: U6 snRNA-associated Sm-like protein LSm6 [Thermoprotei archaeon]|nr:U6 snRNA-associated Sm-like protein LSm6 [Thermoprotei archaeon]
MSETVNPIKYLREAVNNSIYVKLKDGSEYLGILRVTDNTMNLILDETVEVKGGKTRVAKIGRALIRGSMIQYVSFNPDIAAEQALTG